MRAALLLAGAALLAACAASPPPQPTYISGPIVPDELVVSREHSGSGRSFAPTPPPDGTLRDQLDDIEQQLRTLRDQLRPSPAAGAEP